VVTLGMFVVALIGVGYGTRIVGPMVGGAITSLESLRITETEPDGVVPIEAQEQNPDTSPESTPAVQPVAPGPEPESLDRLDDLAQRTNSAIGGYENVAADFDAASGFCINIQAAFVEVQDAWFDYSATGTAQLAAPLDPDRAARDKTLYGAVQNVEIAFGETGCPRP